MAADEGDDRDESTPDGRDPDGRDPDGRNPDGREPDGLAGLGGWFAGVPMFGDLARAMAGQGPLNWDAARQFAALASTDGGVEPNVDPTTRIALEQLAGIAAMHVADVLAVPVSAGRLDAVTRGVWAQRTLDAYRPLFTEMASSLGQRPQAGDDQTDPMAAMMAGLTQMMAPAMMGMAIGSMVGRMARRAFGQYDLPVPRPSSELVVVPQAIDEFAATWSLAVDELRLWVLTQELIGQTVFGLGTVREDLSALVRRHAGAFRPDPQSLAEHLGALDVSDAESDPMASIQRMMSDPAVVLGAVQSDEQRQLQPTLDAAFGALVGVVDYVSDAVAVRLIGGDALQIAEAIRRRRLDTGPDDIYIQRLLGLSLTQGQVQRGKAFIAGAVDRVGEHRLAELLSRPGALPTPAEFEAPGLWVARLEL